MDSQKIWLWLSAAVLFVVGFILVMSDSSAGWFLIILGITYLGLTTRPGQTWSSSNPSLARWVLIGVTLLLVLLTVIVGVVLLLK
jgi:hypothetical protein